MNTKQGHRIFGVGFVGEGENKVSICGVRTKEYLTWWRMLERCYNIKKRNVFKNYEGCTVEERWFNFQNFCEDIKEIKGYSEWKKNTEKMKYSLDKDIKIKGNKLYSKDTCLFVTISENSRESFYRNKENFLTGKKYLAFKNDEKIIFENQREFQREYNLSSGSINKFFKGRYKHVKGWKFKIIEDREVI